MHQFQSSIDPKADRYLANLEEILLVWFQSSIDPKADRYQVVLMQLFELQEVPILDRPESRSLLENYFIFSMFCGNVPILDRPESRSLRGERSRNASAASVPILDQPESRSLHVRE